MYNRSTLHSVARFVILSILFAATSAGATTPETATLHLTLPPDPLTHEWRTGQAEVAVPPPTTAREAARMPQARFAPDQVTVQAPPPGTKYVWQVVLLIYPSIDCNQTVSGVTTHFTYTMTSAEIAEAQTAGAGMKTGIEQGSGGDARIKLTTVVVGRSLTSLSTFGADIHWPAPTNTSTELITYCSGGKADSAMIYWPSRNPSTGAGINNPYWGLSYGAPASYTYNVGYSTVANITSPIRSDYYPGEVMIHEWLHPTTDYYHTVWGAVVPNLDGAGNYRPLPSSPNYAYVYGDGWMPFYRDIMKGTVWNPATSHFEGLGTGAWNAGTPTNYTEPFAAARGWQLYQ